MTQQGRLSIVTVTYQSAAVIGDWLDSIAVHLPTAEVIVVDNESTDGSAQIARAHRLRPTVIDTGGNLGFGRGCNLGAQSASAGVVWFLNPDARIESVDADSLTAALAVRPFGLLETAMATAGGAVLYETFMHRGWLGEWLTHVVTPLWPRSFGRVPWSLTRGDDWASGASLLVDADEFRVTGGFDPAIFLLYEDRELAARYRTKGLGVRTSEAVVTSHEQGTSSEAVDLDVRRRAWALLSWIEMVARHENIDSAGRRARAICAGLRLSHSVGRLLGTVLGSDSRVVARLVSSGRVMDEVAATLERVNSSGFYGRAAQAFRGVTGGAND